MVITVERNNTYFIWLSFFLYATITSIAVQFVVLPYFYPALHAGDGLMRTLDSPEFHLKALETYTSSQKIGWSAWPLSGESRGIVNVISFFYIATGVAKPWVLIPLNAFLHASAGTLLFVLYRRFFASTTSAAIAAAPFVFFPSSMLWYTQLHKDGFVILGTLSMLLGWVTLCGITSFRNEWQKSFISIIQIPFGAGLIWLMRPYHAQLMFILSILIIIGLTTILITHWRKDFITTKHVIKKISFMVLILLAITPFSKGAPLISYSHEGACRELTGGPNLPCDEEKFKKMQSAVTTALANSDSITFGKKSEVTKDGIVVESSSKIVKSLKNKSIDEHLVSVLWKEENIFPKLINDRFISIAYYRSYFLRKYSEAGSNIDANIHFTSPADIVMYIPRALQISLLAPFPSQLFKKHEKKSSLFMYRVVLFEMIIVYAALLIFPLAVYRWRSRPEFWIITGSCVVILVFFGCLFVNTGTLHRMRYLYLMTIVGIGIIPFVDYLSAKLNLKWHKK